MQIQQDILMRCWRQQSFISVLLLSLPGILQAQRAAAAVVPGLSVRYGQKNPTDTVVFQRSVTRAGRDSSAGTRQVVLHLTTGSDNTPLLEVEQRFPAGGGEIVDTSVSELASLRAVAHRSHQPTRTMRFTFGRDAAEGIVSDSAVRQPLGGPIFDSNVIDLVVAALPLREGFTAELPFFIYERGGRVAMPVTVRERSSVEFARLGKRDVWIVSVGVPGVPATVWVDTRTHAPLRVRYDVQARAMSFTDERVTALPG